MERMEHMYPHPLTSQNVKIFLDKSIICKRCQNIPFFFLAMSPGVSIGRPISYFLPYHLLPSLPSLGGEGVGGEEQSVSSR